MITRGPAPKSCFRSRLREHANGAPKLPNELASVIQRDVSSRSPDPRAIAAQLKSVGRDPETALSEAQALLDKIGSPVKATALTVGAVVQLGIYGAHLKKHAPGRPQKSREQAE